MKLINACLFCGSTHHVCRFQAQDRWFPIDGVFNMHQCLDCGLLFLNPQPEPQELAAHYPANYYAYEGDRPDDDRDRRLYQLFYGQGSSRLKKFVSLHYRPILRTMPGRHVDCRFLDVGCGSGHFLAIVKEVMNADAYGVEPYAYDATFAANNGLTIFNGTLEQAAFPEQFFDVVTLNHVFEHVRDPRSTMRELRRILKPGGQVVIGVPQSNCLLYWLFGKAWWQLDVPRHMFVPSSGNLRRLAKEMGFDVTAVRYNSTSASILSTLYYWRNGKAYLMNFTQHRLAFRALLPIAYILNFFGIADQCEIMLTYA